MPNDTGLIFKKFILTEKIKRGKKKTLRDFANHRHNFIQIFFLVFFVCLHKSVFGEKSLDSIYAEEKESEGGREKMNLFFVLVDH